MRVLFVSLQVFGRRHKGGGERYVSELTRAMRQNGVKVQVAVVESIFKLSRMDDPDKPPVPISFSGLMRMVRDSDVVHVHQLNTPGFDYSAALATLFRKPLVLTDHGGGALTPGRALGRARLRLITAAGFVSQWSRSDVDPAGTIKNYAIIFGGGDHLPRGEAMANRYDFGFVGRLLPHKGAHIAIAALPDNASLIVAGEVRDAEYHAELLRLASGKNVTFVADASDEYVAGLMRSIRYLLVPSVQSYKANVYARPELLGLVALEALAAGTPVIGSDVGGLGEIMRVAGQAMVEPGSISAWKLALRSALDEDVPPVRRSEFTWSRVAEKCIELYSSAASRSVVANA